MQRSCKYNEVPKRKACAKEMSKRSARSVEEDGMSPGVHRPVPGKAMWKVLTPEDAVKHRQEIEAEFRAKAKEAKCQECSELLMAVRESLKRGVALEPEDRRAWIRFHLEDNGQPVKILEYFCRRETVGEKLPCARAAWRKRYAGGSDA